eukprot:TRINITY_DN7945_c0_g1::TRINITY_DN7945_c0_g1_i1::g.15594::m.15594 TRINITY_DN7945_c0_g1::TRINITY_DN7945_c0_g1_i1::g.15594  ORF type:complete len:246 (+),score=15.47,His_Phos_1/PF00300.17/4.1e-06 TRINITY_DN7945_c0_g1_i1:229-966(+)
MGGGLAKPRSDVDHVNTLNSLFLRVIIVHHAEAVPADANEAQWDKFHDNSRITAFQSDSLSRSLSPNGLMQCQFVNKWLSEYKVRMAIASVSKRSIESRKHMLGGWTVEETTPLGTLHCLYPKGIHAECEKLYDRYGEQDLSLYFSKGGHEAFHAYGDLFMHQLVQCVDLTKNSMLPRHDFSGDTLLIVGHTSPFLMAAAFRLCKAIGVAPDFLKRIEGFSLKEGAGVLIPLNQDEEILFFPNPG